MALMRIRKDKPLLENKEIQQEESFQRMWKVLAEEDLKEPETEEKFDIED